MLIPLSLAHVNFIFTGKIPSELLNEHDPDYTQFEGIPAQTNSSAESIRVSLEYGKPPAIVETDRLYDGGDSWSVYRRQEGYLLSNTPPGMKQPIWVIAANHDFSTITIYLNDRYEPGGRSNKLFYPLRYPLDQILLMHYLGSRNGLIVHSAGFLWEGRAFVLAGRSGAGKTTIASCLQNNPLFTMLSDDRIIIRAFQGAIHAYGTPWPGDGKIAVNRNGELGGICFLHKSPENRIERITPQQAFESLMPTVSIPWYHEEMVRKLFNFCEQLVKDIPMYDLHFSPTKELSSFLERSIA